jgi:hypothetical protein
MRKPVLNRDVVLIERFRLNRLEQEIEDMLACRLAAVRKGSKVPILIQG